MFLTRRLGAVFGACGLVVLSSCTDSGVVQPDAQSDGTPSFDIIDGSTFGSSDFFFLQPIADKAPDIVGEFNPFLLPELRVCEIWDLGVQGRSCDDSSSNRIVAEFSAGSAEVGSDQYQISWDTDGPETEQIDTDRFLLLEILVSGTVMGSVELDPQDPDGPGQSDEPAFPFRVGETIPVKFWLSQQVLCDGDVYVTECITGAVIDETGGTLSLESEGNKLGVIIFEGALPGENAEPITVTVERIDPFDFLQATGEECIPLLDAPQFSDCFRIRTIPELADTLDIPALVSICLDPTLLDGIDIPADQQDQLTMIRFNDSGDDSWESLADAVGDCPTQSASLVPVPDEGLFKYAARGINAVASLLGPEPLEARDVRLGGLTSSFSRFRYALPGQMIPTTGDGAIIQASDSDTIDAVVNVVDHEGLPVENAIVHFTSDDGTLSGDTAVSDVDGNASVQWVVDRILGKKVLTATGLGLFADEVLEHSDNYLFTAESVTLTVTVIGPPSSVAADPSSNIDDAVAGEAQALTVTVTDAAGNPVEGASVGWSCSEDCTIPDTSGTDSSGETTIDWTPETTGAQSATASVDGVGPTQFTATVGPAAAVEPTYSDPPETGTAGLTLGDPLVVTVTDAFGNPRIGDEVTWAVTNGGGSTSTGTNYVGADGTAQVAWTLGEAAGENSVLVSVAGFSSTFTVTGVPGPMVQPAGTGSGQTGVVNSALPTLLSVTVTDQFGNTIEGETVSWTGDGSFSSATAGTDATGVAQTTWTLGTVAGAQNATAGVGGFTVDFTATGTPGAAADLGALPDAPTNGLVGSTIPLSIVVTDAFGNVRAGDAVTWSVTSGGGSVQNGGSVAAADGSSTASWILGPLPGANTATVSAAGLQANFWATGECFDGWGVGTADGDFGASEWACAESLPFTANLSGGDTDAEVYWMNDDTNLYLAVRVRRSSLDKTNSVRFDFDNDGDGVTEAGDDAIGFDGNDLVFLDESLTDKCLNRNQSGCGEDDSSVDGSGAVANDGTWTTYELVHPRSSGDEDDFSVSTNDLLGFYLTLRQGNGAQGNTQFPDFRQYANITIVGF